MRIPYALRNLRHRLRGLPQEAYRVARLKVAAELSFVHFTACERGADGAVLLDALGIPLAFNRRIDYGVVSRRVVTTAGVNWLATAFTNTVEAESLNWHDVGTGTTAEAIGQTALVTPYGGSRASGTQSTPGSTNIYQSQATITFAGTFAVTEHGLFTASTAGTLWDRSLFSAINVVSADSLQATHQTTFPSGG
jgi:hypothetical protein